VDRTITAAEAERFYDRLGAGLDRFARFEEAARIDLLEHGEFERASAVVEFGCGTGRFAARLLGRLPPEARYLGLDVSATMVAAARERLRPFPGRAAVRKTDGSLRVPEPDARFDRFVATFVLDLLRRDDQAALVDEAWRVLVPEGLLCLTSLAHGETLLSRAVSGLWACVQHVAPARVGGCRPIRLADALPAGRWRIEYRRVVTMLGVPAEVVAARRATPAGPGPRP
jgi:ubiquinone/menaquinone biosynthesis C-methylase UbiE